MKRPGAGLWIVLLLGLAAGCDAGADAGDRFTVTADTVDLAMTPGVIFRHGPATPEAIAAPVTPPVVRGGEGRLSIYDGFFIRAPCSTPLQVQARRGDTVTVRVWSEPDTTAADPCPEEPKPVGYSMLVGPFDPGTYTVRVSHEGDGARPVLLDTVYEDITVDPK